MLSTVHYFYCCVIFHWMAIAQYVYSFACGTHLGCFPFETIPDKAALNMYIQVFGHMFSFSQVQNSRLTVFFFRHFKDAVLFSSHLCCS